jgi:RNA polymerase sigma-70 factor, ECF subfamily
VNPPRGTGHGLDVTTIRQDNTTDAELWLRIRAGEHDAFGDVFDRHADAVYRHLLRRTGNWAEAEDLSSAVFLHAWRRRDEITPHGDSILPWLLGVANGVLGNSRRSRRRFSALLARVPPPGPVPDHADDVADRLDDERVAAQLRDSVARLPRRERDVVELCCWDELSQEAAALTLGIPVGTVKSRLHRARRRLGNDPRTASPLALPESTSTETSP